MVKNLLISLFLLNFAIGIVGFGHPMIREYLIPPFPFNKDKIIERISNMPKKMTKDEFVRRAITIHGDKYAYENVNYVDSHTPILINCNKCGKMFKQLPYSHLNGRGCPTCSINSTNEKKRLPIETWKERARAKHDDFYDYSLVTYKNLFDKVWIGCPLHGFFLQEAKSHMDGQNCPICAGKHRWNYDGFIKKAKELYGEKYSYDKVKFVNMHTKIIVTCKEHGDFETNPSHFIHGHGCAKCARERISNLQALTKDEFIEHANKIHGNKYNYSKVIYVNGKKPVEIICEKHGSFWQRPNNHLNGAGCPHCPNTTISKGEDYIYNVLNKMNVEFLQQYRIKNDNLFCKSKYIRVDFFLPSMNVIIEYNGGQHYKPVKYFGGELQFDKQQERDMALRQYCKEHKIKLIEIPYWDYDNIEIILKEKLKIK